MESAQLCRPGMDLSWGSLHPQDREQTLGHPTQKASHSHTAHSHSRQLFPISPPPAQCLNLKQRVLRYLTSSQLSPHLPTSGQISTTRPPDDSPHHLTSGPLSPSPDLWTTVPNTRPPDNSVPCHVTSSQFCLPSMGSSLCKFFRDAGSVTEWSLQGI